MQNKNLFTRRLAALFLVQTGIIPTDLLGLKPKKAGFARVKEILDSKEYWEKKAKDWPKKEEK